MSNIADLLRSRLEHQSILAAAGQLGQKQGISTYVVGGYVRDLILDRNTHDIDLMVEGDGIAFARALGRGLGTDRVVVYEKFGTAHIPLKGTQVEVATARTETYTPDSRKPKVTASSVEADLSRRDFTINALAVSVLPDTFGDLIDPFQGIRDMRAGTLRTPLAPDATFSDDPLRMLRAARFAAQLHFDIEPECLASITRQAGRMSIVSWERITEEIMKLLAADRPSVGFYILKETGLLAHVFPELDVMSGVEIIDGKGHKDVFIHTLQVVDNAAALSPKPALRFAALVHDIAKPRTKRFDRKRGWTFHHHEEAGRKILGEVARRMHLSNDLRDYLMNLTKLHLRPIALAQEGVSDSAVRRVMREAGADVDDLMLLCRADVTTKREARIARYMANFERVEALMKDVTVRDEMAAFQSPVRGDEIMKICSLEPGRAVGRLKTAIEEAILEGRIENTHAAALVYLQEIKGEVLQASR
ncbi:MAG: HD domain-containing protein [Candidatus Marinimicrobia bacterium]|nr:HD domain-containing protein [Candidatus Neomarinimicrobiota bacterium]